jgi:hypothetical protein
MEDVNDPDRLGIDPIVDDVLPNRATAQAGAAELWERGQLLHGGGDALGAGVSLAHAPPLAGVEDDAGQVGTGFRGKDDRMRVPKRSFPCPMPAAA